MAIDTLLNEPDHVNEPGKAQEYSGLLSRVATTHQPVIVRRDGADIAAVIAVEHLELLQELLAQREAEALASQVDWTRAIQLCPPAQQWFEENEPKPF